MNDTANNERMPQSMTLAAIICADSAAFSSAFKAADSAAFKQRI